MLLHKMCNNSDWFPSCLKLSVWQDGLHQGFQLFFCLSGATPGLESWCCACQLRADWDHIGLEPQCRSDPANNQLVRTSPEVDPQGSPDQLIVRSLADWAHSGACALGWPQLADCWLALVTTQGLKSALWVPRASRQSADYWTHCQCRESPDSWSPWIDKYVTI